jgi:hypothetical protein
MAVWEATRLVRGCVLALKVGGSSDLSHSSTSSRLDLRAISGPGKIESGVPQVDALLNPLFSRSRASGSHNCRLRNPVKLWG